ncbi:uncharacterized protein THITE_2120715 [Thermothielavioides terrestris NRRL 8126]|uniref:C2H2-type domain-containing protein n=2 Tax=Thermothielavioides terrestris TaxID=2587410 RepID=G2RDG8_THETT|nr:uncharacterized protein THITE_2120715 [Thermothielavioides terrestris NRRL 8126]AEO69950.1 hypothetical protein THITE_2120715 [Thermothielavioides terrestris NRRL 8126]
MIPIKPEPDLDSASATSDLHSLDSETLHETRPNRWRGHPSTWQGWTERDRETWTALENARRGDLAVHLYNACGLKRGWRAGPVQDGDGNGDDDGAGKGWKPDKGWTAWPMKADEVPDDGLLPRAADVNEPFTLRREDRARSFAGCNLEEEISAAMLRCAKERFRRRGLQRGAAGGSAPGVVVQSVEKDDANATATEGETDASGTAATSAKDEDDTDADALARVLRRKRRRAVSPTFTPVLSADDERSSALLRPLARRIMAQLDDTLMILHNQRVAGLGCMSESSASDDDETGVESVPQRAAKSPPPRRYRGGRPKKVHVPREGETEREMLVRLAREGKRKIPTFSSDESEPGRGERSRGRTRSVSSKRRAASASSQAASRSEKSRSRSSSVSSELNREKRLSRWGLRDWRDVLGAAALAGFSPATISRAAQRCATLFREEITMHTLHEQSAASERPAVETVRYVPGAPLPPSSDEETESEEELLQLRTVSRQSSLRPAGASSPEPEREVRRRSRSGTPGILVCPHPGCPRAAEGFRKRSNLERHIRTVHKDQTADYTDYTDAELTEAGRTPRRRSRSATPGGTVHLCHYPHCPRAVEGFRKRSNLARHLRSVHGKRAADFAEDEEDTMDEMDGGVHVDGFLRPIKVRKGWRGDDVQPRPPRSRKRARQGSEELDSFLS